MGLHMFSILYTTLLHNLIKEKNLTVLFEQNFNREGFHHLAHNEKHAFSLWNNRKDTIYGHVRKFVMLSIISQKNIYQIRL